MEQIKHETKNKRNQLSHMHLVDQTYLLENSVLVSKSYKILCSVSI
jgi:hypothetical protein